MSSQKKKEGGKNSLSGIVYIKKEAFRNMITHVLRFGNEAIESVEVIGVCLGKTSPNGKDVELINAIPITHGEKISRGFSSKDFTTFSKIEERYPNLNFVGWYSSHPGWGLFFSDVAIKNHRFFQNDQKPYGFYIVFDHTLMGKNGDLGFEIYRLNDYKDEMAKEYHKVAYELEKPNTLEYFQWVQKFVEDTQRKSPLLIKELSELKEPVPSDLQEIPKAKDAIVEDDKKEQYPEIKPIISGFKQGPSQFAELFLDTFQSQLGNWTKEVKRGSLNGTQQIRNSINLMKEKISFGISKVEKWFNINLNSIISDFKKSVSNYVDSQIELQKELSNQIDKSKEEITNSSKKIINDNLKSVINDIENKIKIISDKINNVFQENSKVEQLINKSSEQLSKIVDETNILSDNMEEDVNETFSSFEQNVISEIEKLNTELNYMKDFYSQIINTSKKLQEVIKNLQKM